MIGHEGQFLFARTATAVAQPSKHPFVDGLTHLERCAVAARPDDPRHTLRDVVELVPALRLVEDLPRAGRCKEVVLRRSNQPGLRREQLDVIGLVETGREESGDALFGIPNRAGEQRPERVHVARDRGHLDPLVQRRDIRRLRASAGTACDADALRVDLGAADEVIDRAHAVMDEVPRDGLPHENSGGAVGEVLFGRSADQRSPHARIVGLLTLALADRIVRQHDEALPREVRREELPGCLAGIPMSHGHEDRRVRPRPLGTIEVSCHVVAREALEQHMVYRKPIPLRRPGHGRVQRSAVVRQIPNQLEHALPHLSLPPGGGRHIPNRGDCSGTTIELPLRNRVQLPQERRRLSGVALPV